MIPSHLSRTLLEHFVVHSVLFANAFPMCDGALDWNTTIARTLSWAEAMFEFIFVMPCRDT
eukprot:m.630886 g.630886  ORF g.630886 m.630886 type:complete len:61 (+) comp22568_c0_seq17:126-308(+)